MRTGGISKYYAKGRLKAGALNQSEANYEAYLRALCQTGDILWFKFEGIRLILAQGCTYTPDFVVMLKDGTIELHEVKGSKALFRDDAKVKVKMAASLFPFRIKVVYPRRKMAGWDEEIFE